MNTQSKYPKPLYAAAGAGDLAVEKLLELPAKVSALRAQLDSDNVATALRTGLADLSHGVRDELRDAFDGLHFSGDMKTDFDTARLSAIKGASVMVATAQRGAAVAQEKAMRFYGELTERGMRVVDGASPAESESSSAPAPAAPTSPAAAPTSPAPAEASPAAETPLRATVSAEPKRNVPVKKAVAKRALRSRYKAQCDAVLG